MKYPWNLLFLLFLLFSCDSIESKEEVTQPSPQIISLDKDKSLFTWTLEKEFENGPLTLDSGNFFFLNDTLIKITAQSSRTNLNFVIDDGISEEISLALTINIQDFKEFDGDTDFSMDSTWQITDPTHSVISTLIVQDSLRRIPFPIKMIRREDSTFLLEGKVSTDIKTSKIDQERKLLLGFQFYSDKKDKDL